MKDPTKPTTEAILRDLTVDRLLAFRSVHDAGGYARAAPGNPVRQSQLNRQVRQLEGTLKVALFDNDSGRIVPTEAGVRLAGLIRDLEHGIASLREDVAPAPVLVAAGGSVLQWLVAPALPLSEAGAEGVPLTFVTESSEEVAAQVLGGAADLGIIRAVDLPKGLNSGLKKVGVGRVGYAWFAARSLIGETPPPANRLDRAAPLVAISGEPRLDPMFAALGEAAVTCENFAQAAAVVRAGRCAGLLPTFAAAELRPEEFHRVTLSLTRPYEDQLTLLWRLRVDDARPEVAAVREGLKQALQQALREG